MKPYKIFLCLIKSILSQQKHKIKTSYSTELIKLIRRLNYHSFSSFSILFANNAISCARVLFSSVSLEIIIDKWIPKIKPINTTIKRISDGAYLIPTNCAIVSNRLLKTENSKSILPEKSQIKEYCTFIRLKRVKIIIKSSNTKLKQIIMSCILSIRTPD